MDKQLHIQYWLDSADHDLDAAETLFNSGKYDWCLFIGHLVIEKVLKAFYTRDNDVTPPKIHNLPRLAEKINLQFSDEQKTILTDINDFNLEARYPDQKLLFYKLCTKEFTGVNFNTIKEMYSWLLSQMKQ
jgi:HEPN domain-containing protein